MRFFVFSMKIWPFRQVMKVEASNTSYNERRRSWKDAPAAERVSQPECFKNFQSRRACERGHKVGNTQTEYFL
jgi:hypothetical protein